MTGWVAPPRLPAMSKHLVAVSLMVSLLALMAPAQELKLETETEKASYLIGRNIGGSIKADGLELNIDNLVAGLTEAIAGGESKISDEDANAVMMAFQKTVQAAQEAKAAEAATENAAAGTKFLEENKKREGVTTTESGLQYEIITKGDGPMPKASETVSVHYHGTLLDGTVFDSSVDRGQPAQFPVNQVIKGWVEALQLMPVGSKWKLYIPSDLAYGDRGAGGAIGPGAMLTFEVELLEIVGGQ